MYNKCCYHIRITPFNTCFRQFSLISRSYTQYRINKFQQPAGIYFQTIGNLGLSNTQWQLITYINITNYENKYNQVVSIVERVENSCKLGEKLEIQNIEHRCNQYRQQAKELLTEIKNDNEHILKVIERPKIDNYRRKRGLINLVGRTANVLFGVCDDADSDYFYKKIKELEESKSRTTQVLNSQIRVLKSVISNVNSSLIEAEKNQDMLTDSYDNLRNEMVAEKLQIGLNKFKIALEERIELLNLIFIQYSFETTNLENIVNTALHGFIRSSLLDASTLKEQLKEIKS